MITIMIGNDTEENYKYIKSLAREEALKNEVLCNYIDINYLSHIKYNRNRIKELKDLLNTDLIIEHKDSLHIKTDIIDVGISFENILTVICKGHDRLFLNEPELSLSQEELDKLIEFLVRTEDTFKKIVIATQQKCFLNILNNTVKTS